MKLTELRSLLHGMPTDGRLGQQQMYDAMRSAGLEPGSLYQELEMDSRSVNTHRDTSYSNESVYLHSHSFYEVLYCRSSGGVEYLVGSRRYRLQRGDVVFVSPGTSHRPILPEKMPEPYQRDVLWFSQEFIEQLEPFFPSWESANGSHLLRTADTKWEFLGSLFSRGVTEELQKEPGWELAVLGNTQLLLAQLYRAYTEPCAAAPRAEAPELLDQVLAYVESNLSRRITLKDTARHCFTSESSISHLFRQKMGVSFYRCVIQRRLILAKELIGRNLPMEEVSRQAGFQDYSAFYRAFKQEYGISPNQYRKLLNAAE